MKWRTWTHGLMLLAIASCVGLTLSGPARAQERAAPGELRLLRVLVVLDTLDKKLGDSLQVDYWRIRRTLTQTLPKQLCKVDFFVADKATASAVLSYYRQLRSGPDEALLCYYGGHGAIDPKKGPYFKFNKGPVLFREELRQAMQSKNAGLVVLLSDCCSELMRVCDVTKRDLPVPTTKLHPTVRALFFRSRGVVDITSAEQGKFAYGSPSSGGLFTRAFCKLLERQPREFDVPADSLDWKRFEKVLHKEMAISFDVWRNYVLRSSPHEAKLITDSTQVPFVYKLSVKRIDASSSDSQRLAVVSIRNGYNRSITYSYRWTGESAWQKKTLGQGQRQVHFTPSNRSGLKLEIRVEGDRESHPLDSKLWSGKGEPRFEDGIRYTIHEEN